MKGIEEVIERFAIGGDIIITDPCYIRKFVCTTHEQDTLYGDWGCHVWQTGEDCNIINSKAIGQFCADSSMVCVTDICKAHDRESIEAFLRRSPHAACLIEGFDGIVEYVKRTVCYNGSTGVELIIRGKGKQHGKPFYFATCQTSL